MSGHSKWSTIKRKKASIDAKRGDLFGKLARAIAIAARDNPDPNSNTRLRDVMVRARAANMPNEKIERAIKKVTEKDSAALSELLLEFIGPGDSALIVSGITDNTNRTISELRKLAADHGGRMVQQGSVSWMFKKSSIIRARIGNDVDGQQLGAIDAGADDVSVQDDELFVIAPVERAEAVNTFLGEKVVESSLSFVATSPLTLQEESDVQKLQKLIGVLEEHDDVQDVATNAEI